MKRSLKLKHYPICFREIYGEGWIFTPLITVKTECVAITPKIVNSLAEKMKPFDMLDSGNVEFEDLQDLPSNIRKPVGLKLCYPTGVLMDSPENKGVYLRKYDVQDSAVKLWIDESLTKFLSNEQLWSDGVELFILEGEDDHVVCAVTPSYIN